MKSKAVTVLQFKNMSNKWKMVQSLKYIQDLPWAAVDSVDTQEDIYNPHQKGKLKLALKKKKWPVGWFRLLCLVSGIWLQ